MGQLRTSNFELRMEEAPSAHLCLSRNLELRRARSAAPRTRNVGARRSHAPRTRNPMNPEPGVSNVEPWNLGTWNRSASTKSKNRHRIRCLFFPTVRSSGLRVRGATLGAYRTRRPDLWRPPARVRGSGRASTTRTCVEPFASWRRMRHQPRVSPGWRIRRHAGSPPPRTGSSVVDFPSNVPPNTRPYHFSYLVRFVLSVARSSAHATPRPRPIAGVC
jgi:hypothetical protein